jgi:dihydroorotate dehydrogenase
MPLDFYTGAIRPLIFSGLQADPEGVQVQTLRACAALDARCDRPEIRWLLQQWRRSFGLEDPRLQQSVAGLVYPNPIGLAAGFDKDGMAANIWPALGFGLMEVGTVTRHAQPGNPKPRLFRLPQDQAAINRMGFNNQGCEQMAARLQQARSRSWGAPITPLGINLGKSKITPLEEAVEDYLTSFRTLQAYGDYFVVNVSSPNTPGLRSLQAVEQLDPILAALQAENQGHPLWLKIAPDLEWAEIDAIVELVQTYRLAGIIATNTTIQRTSLNTQRIPATGKSPKDEAGGLSGKPVQARSTEVIRYIYQRTQGSLPIIGVGGVFTAADAWEKITAGASFVQVYTGWLYEGPWMVRRLLRGLLQYMEQEGMEAIVQAVGVKASP